MAHPAEQPPASLRSSDQGRWVLSDCDEPDSWLPVPRDVDAPAANSWVRRVLEMLRETWGTGWDEQYRDPLGVALSTAVRTRTPEGGALYLTWPLTMPIFVAIELNVVDSADLPDWPAEDYEVIPYVASGLGPGVHCTLETYGEWAGKPSDLVQSFFVFDDGVSSVIVSTDQVPVALASLINADLQRFVQSVVMTRPDRLSFRAVDPELAKVASEDRWELGTSDRE